MAVINNETTTTAMSDLTVQICCRERENKTRRKKTAATWVKLAAVPLNLLTADFSVGLSPSDSARGQWRSTGRWGVGERGDRGIRLLERAHLWWNSSVWSLVWLMMRNGAAPSWYSENRMVAECSDRLTSTMIPPTCTAAMRITLLWEPARFFVVRTAVTRWGFKIIAALSVTCRNNTVSWGFALPCRHRRHLVIDWSTWRWCVCSPNCPCAAGGSFQVGWSRWCEVAGRNLSLWSLAAWCRSQARMGWQTAHETTRRTAENM